MPLSYQVRVLRHVSSHCPSHPTMVEAVRLYKTSSEREKWETLADLYAIFVTVEHLEKAYIRDAVKPSDYTDACTRLIAQFKTGMELVGETIDWPQFMAKYSLTCPAAMRRLLLVGVPATVEHAHSASSEDAGKQARHIAEAVQHFITVMDSLNINMVAADQLHPLLSSLIQSLNKITSLPKDFEGRGKIRDWLIKLNKMNASEKLPPEQARQLLFDLERAHTDFFQFLNK